MEQAAAHPAPSRLFRLACALVGADPELMAACPARDRDGVRLLCTLMMLVWLWQSAIFAAVAHLMLAGPGEIRPDLIVGAVLLATIILLIDAYVVMRPSWTGLGYEELRRGGLAIRLPVSARVKGGAFLALRVALSGVIGTLVALFVSLILYGKDIAGQLAVEHAARNAPVIAAAERRSDERITRNAGSQADLRSRIAAADRAADGLRRGLAERADPATAGAANELARAERIHERTEAEVARQRRRADASGLARAQRHLDAAARAREAARTRLTEAENRALPLAQGRDTVLTGQLAALDAQRRQDLDQLAMIEAEQRTMLDGRAVAVRAAVVADPAYAAPDDGLLARLRALRVLTADLWVGAVVALLEVFFAGVELAAVFSKLLSFVPATYATRLAREDHLRQVATARAIGAVLGGREEPPEGSARPMFPEASGIVSAAGVLASSWPVEAPVASAAASDESDRGAPDRPDTDFPPARQAAGSDQAALAPDTLMPTETDAAGEHPPQRRRGRPPKPR